MAIIQTDKAPAAIGPYIQGVKLGNLVITSGQLPLDPESKQMPNDAAEQTTRSLLNALAIVEEAGLSIHDFVKTTVFVKDLNEFSVINESYQAFFEQRGADFPARSCVEVARLPMDVKVEIEVMASR
ncbi:Rid family detoxifying hydrolase [Vibrio ouci]|uniref:Reactive intermediate/imine deaminase n=1 Tax=Vibrio ouci TaxID=2499078 RepID=A0A4Y8WHR5_9VIBR|nr:Rid family detoxifying hydrolase [Vibrio ouci]TFH92213.1 reactive intermediate/imine deaminase [Vibrio ouci]